MIKAWLASLFIAAAPLPADAPVKQCLRNCHVTPAGIALIREFEGYSPYPYRDAAGHLTIGTGHLMQKGRDYPIPLVGKAAEDLLREDVAKHSAYVNRAVTVPLWPLQHDSVSSWTFNLGPGALKQSTMLKRINAGRHDDVPAEMKRWNRAGGKVLRGLIRRREAEADLYEQAKP